MSNLIQARQLNIESLLEALNINNLQINGTNATLNDVIASLQDNDRDFNNRLTNIENASGILPPSADNVGNNIISSIDPNYFDILVDTVTNDKKLTLLDIDQSKICGITDTNGNTVSLFENYKLSIFSDQAGAFITLGILVAVYTCIMDNIKNKKKSKAAKAASSK